MDAVAVVPRPLGEPDYEVWARISSHWLDRSVADEDYIMRGPKPFGVVVREGSTTAEGELRERGLPAGNYEIEIASSRIPVAAHLENHDPGGFAVPSDLQLPGLAEDDRPLHRSEQAIAAEWVVPDPDMGGSSEEPNPMDEDGVPSHERQDQGQARDQGAKAGRGVQADHRVDLAAVVLRPSAQGQEEEQAAEARDRLGHGRRSLPRDGRAVTGRARHLDAGGRRRRRRRRGARRDQGRHHHHPAGDPRAASHRQEGRGLPPRRGRPHQGGHLSRQGQRRPGLVQLRRTDRRRLRGPDSQGPRGGRREPLLRVLGDDHGACPPG